MADRSLCAVHLGTGRSYVQGAASAARNQSSGCKRRSADLTLASEFRLCFRCKLDPGKLEPWVRDLKPHVMEVLVCNTRKNAVRDGSKSDRIDARKLRDSGIGFDPEDASRWNGLGLTSIRERLKLVNGKSSWIRNHSAGQRFRLACLSVPK